jgi:hypothetical protein
MIDNANFCCSNSSVVEEAISRSKASAEREMGSEEEVYSSGEETTTMWTVENRKVFEEFRNVEIDVSLQRKGILATEAEQQGSHIVISLRHIYQSACI